MTSVFRSFRETETFRETVNDVKQGDRNGLSTFSNGLSSYSRNSLYYHHQNTLKPRFATISDFRLYSCGLSKCLCGQQGQTLKNLVDNHSKVNGVETMMSTIARREF